MPEALGVIETLGFTTAMQAADAAIKAAHVRLGEWVKVGGGKVNIIIRGDVAAVKSAVDAGVAFAEQVGQVQGQTIIPSPSNKLSPLFPIEIDLVPETKGAKTSELKAIGILETRGFVPLIDGVDAAVKAASVEIVEWRQVGSGYVSFVVEGDVAAVRTAIDAGRNAAERVGEVISDIVIPRPIEVLETTFNR